ncbi:MAG: RpiB/LacA/LacB family sugar-phosphate isomerase [Bacilli bacterium]|nr:RpiB/LacA/LacB family sugar-phosphate isomerase [Bacilli bacterium]
MRIALINENSQASKNPIIFKELKDVAEPLGHEVINIGMFNPEDKALTYVQNGIIAAVLLNSKAADFVISGCGTGEGAMLALNSFPGVICGYVVEPTDAYLFRQVNDGNAIAMPFAKGFGWGAEINLHYVFEKLLSTPGGEGYPKERREPEQRNKKILDKVKESSYRDLIDILQDIDQDLVKGALDRPSVIQAIEKYAKDEKIKNYVLNLVD